MLSVGQLCKQVKEIVERCKAIGFGGFDNGVKDSTGFCPFRGVAKQPDGMTS